MIWVLIGVVLLLLLGVVSVLQRMGELSRRIATAKKLRARLGSELLDMQSETDFSQAFQSGAAADLTKRSADTLAAIDRDFASANRSLDSVHKAARMMPTLTRMVQVAEVIETYEDIEKRMAPLRDGLKQLSELLKQASGEVEVVQQDWSQTTAVLRRTLNDDVPVAWKQRWDVTEVSLARLGAETDDVKRAGGLAEVRDTVDLWQSVSERLQTWADWQANGEERQVILTACLKRLREQGGDQTSACRDLAEAAEDVTHIRSLSAEAAASDTETALMDRLRGPLTELINRSTQLLHFLADPDAQPTRLTELATRLQAALDTWQTADVQALWPLVEQAEDAWAKAHYARVEAWRAQVKQLLQADAQAQTPVLRADALLQTAAEGQRLRRDLEEHATAAKRAFAQWGARVDALETAIGEALRQLAAANLATSEEYQKWSGWQQQMADLRAQGLGHGAGRMRSWEKRVEAEQRVVEATVAAHDDVDEMMQRHLDQLVRRHGTDIPTPWTARRGQVQTHLARGDMTAASWSALAMAESSVEAARWDSSMPW